MLDKIKKSIKLDNPIRLLYHYIKAVLASFYYGFPSKDMTIIWVTWTNWKTTTCNIIASWLQKSWKKVFMFTTVNIIIWDKNYVNNTKMTSPDPFSLQKYLKKAKNEWCEIAIIETASHWIKMHRVWGIEYDTLVLTNITQDHLDLHVTMDDYVNTKLSIFKHLISYNRKPGIKKTWIINFDSNYSELFNNETYDILYRYWVKWGNINIKAKNIKYDINGSSFTIDMPWEKLHINTSLIWEFNVYNILAAIWVFISTGIEVKEIWKIISNISTVPWRMDEVINNNDLKIFIDYAHTPDALEKVLDTIKNIKWKWDIITVFWATWDRDKTKRPIMWQIVSKYSNKVILTQDDDYSEDTNEIIKDILPWIERKQWEDFWIIPDREIAIRTAILMWNKDDIILIAWKWDEHTIVTNKWPLPWHDKTLVNKILSDLDKYK